MRTQPTSDRPLFPATPTRPAWRDDPLGWCRWYMRENGALYRAFRHQVDERLQRYPRARISADAVLHAIRWHTPINARGDLYKVNNNVAALFARLYAFERPQHAGRFEVRRSVLDDLTDDARHELVALAEVGA